MEDVIRDILARLRAERAGEGEPLDARGLARLLDERNRRAKTPERRYVKKALLPFYLRVREEEPERWRAWNVDDDLEERLRALLRMKPRRTASGVATVTVITKPWPCAGGCAYCPNDVRMPKSYLADEPACQRAERAFFDPYLQVTARVRTLAQMGHPVDKVELIVLGGTWSDYPAPYRRWFVAELFRALNDGVSPQADARAAERRARYEALGIPSSRSACAAGAQAAQRAVDEGRLTYNQAVRALYGAGEGASAREGEGKGAPELPGTAARQPSAGAASGPAGSLPAAGAACRVCDDEGPRQATGASAPATSHRPAPAGSVGSQAGDPALPASAWRRAAVFQGASWEEVEAAQRANERAACRCVGLVVETRPELVDAPALTALRRLGCTKVQMGVQSLDPAVLVASGRGDAGTVDAVARAFALLRLFGFKIHAHFMANLPGATPAGDADDYRRLVSDPRFLPDEVKLYPCVLTAGTPLAARYAAGEWAPYDEETLVALLAADVRATPPWTRISRMIRDIGAQDIVAGNRKTNLRQLVDARIAEAARARAGSAPASGEGACGAGAPGEGAAPASASGASMLLVREIRSREIAGDEVDEAALRLDVVAYATDVSSERFLQWVTPEGRIAGFLRLSLPAAEALAAYPGVPVGPGEAMIRELHVYGRTSPLSRASAGVQHRGLGRRLVEEACALAAAAGCGAVSVISAVGTRDYYRRLGFEDIGLYQRRSLAAVPPDGAAAPRRAPGLPAGGPTLGRDAAHPAGEGPDGSAGEAPADPASSPAAAERAAALRNGGDSALPCAPSGGAR